MDEWDNITVLRRKPAPGSNKTEAAINQARRAGGPIETTKKCNIFFFNFKLSLFVNNFFSIPFLILIFILFF